MRRVPQPVAIITATNTKTHSDESPDDWRGATISSFNTVTLEPEPVISFNIKKPSSTLDAIEASGRLWVHLLTQTSSAIELADKFTKGHSKDLFQGVSVSQHLGHEGYHKFPRIAFNARGGGGQIAFVLECVHLKDKTVAIGDHVVLFASVWDVLTDGSGHVLDGTALHHNRPCLLYVDGEYQRVTHLERSSDQQNMPDGSQAEKL